MSILEFSPVAILKGSFESQKTKMENLINDLLNFRVENLKLVHKIEKENMKKRLQLEYESKLDSLKCEFIEKQEYDLSRLQTKIQKLE